MADSAPGAPSDFHPDRKLSCSAKGELKNMQTSMGHKKTRNHRALPPLETRDWMTAYEMAVNAG